MKNITKTISEYYKKVLATFQKTINGTKSPSIMEMQKLTDKVFIHLEDEASNKDNVCYKLNSDFYNADKDCFLTMMLQMRKIVSKNKIMPEESIRNYNDRMFVKMGSMVNAQYQSCFDKYKSLYESNKSCYEWFSIEYINTIKEISK